MSNRALAFTPERLLQTLNSLPPVNSYIVGFSGGADSTALVHALSKIHEQLKTPVSAVHINHGIHTDADQWQKQCELFCQRHGVELVCIRVELKNDSGKGLEAEARHLRYDAITSLLKPGDCLLTAHHADDQAETVLLNLMRGSGVDGLSAMPESRPLGHGVLQRPLLRFRNSALQSYLRENNVGWTDDPSNYYLDHDRNFVRHQVIPLLEQRWPEVAQRLLLSCEAMGDARHLLEDLADDYLGPNLSHPCVLAITPECHANKQLFKLVTRRWIRQSRLSNIPVYKLDTFCEQVQQADSDNQISVNWDGYVLRWYKNQLWLSEDNDICPCPVINWSKEQSELDLGKDVGWLSLVNSTLSGHQDGSLSHSFPNGEFSVGPRINMKESVNHQGGHHKSLKNLFQSADIPPWLRDAIPLCRLDGELVSLGDWCVARPFENWLHEKGLRLEWRPQHPLLQFIVRQQHKQKH